MIFSKWRIIVESGIICLFKTENEKFSPLLGLSVTKERFRNGDFINEDWIMVAQLSDSLYSCEILYDIMKDNLISKFTIKEFQEKNKKSFNNVNDINLSYKLNLSWFEILQITAISEYNKNYSKEYILQTSKDLCIYYKKMIKIYNF